MKTAGIVMLLSLAFSCFFSGVATQAGGQSIDCSEFQNKVSYCTKESSPHCGTNGRTYGNKCAFCKAVERSNGRLALQHMGKC